MTSIVDRGTRADATRAATTTTVSEAPLGLGERLLFAATLRAGCVLIAVVEWLPASRVGGVVSRVRNR